MPTTRTLRRSEQAFFLALADAAAAGLAVVLALLTWSMTAGEAFSRAFVAGQWPWFTAVPIWVVAMAPTRLPSTALDPSALRRGLTQASAVLFTAYLAAFFFRGQSVLPRLVALYILWNAAWLTWAARLLVLWVLTRESFAKRAIIIGSGEEREAARRLLHSPALADTVVVDDEKAATVAVAAFSGHASEIDLTRLLRLQERGVEVVTFAHLYEQALQRVPAGHVGRDWLLTQLFSGAASREASPLAKRLLDLAAVAVLTPPAVVVGVLAAAAVLLGSGAPVFYSQRRLGQSGRTFSLTKFRTMRPDAESAGPQWSQQDDPRITAVGRILRRTHIDELPNLLAVLRGDMSMVGPRPERPEFVAMLEKTVPLYRARLAVAPGLTGWAQVNAPYGGSVEDALTKLEYDLYYVRHRSVGFDAVILLRTVGRILGWKGR